MNLGENKVNDSGCKFLSRADWSKLKKFLIGTCFIKTAGNLISEKGCKYLSKA